MKACTALQRAIQPRTAGITAARLPARRPICSSAPLATSAHDDTPGSHSRTRAVEASEGRTDSKSSAAAYIAAQAAAEEAHEAEVVRSGQAKRPRVVPDPDAWRGEESRERMLKRILEDQYKPLRVKVSFRLLSSLFRHQACEIGADPLHLYGARTSRAIKSQSRNPRRSLRRHSRPPSRPSFRLLGNPRVPNLPARKIHGMSSSDRRSTTTRCPDTERRIRIVAPAPSRLEKLRSRQPGRTPRSRAARRRSRSSASRTPTSDR